MPTKVDTNEMDALIGLNNNDQEQGIIQKNSYVTDDQEPFFSQTPM